MKELRWLLVSILLTGAVGALPAAAQTPPKKPVDEVLRELGGEAIREIHSDICFPATSEEYEALGKNVILMLEASSAVGTELPLKSAYVLHKGVRVPLQRVALLAKTDEPSGATKQISFYLMPIHFMKVDAELLADFSGERKGFGILYFSSKEGIDESAPAFARLDEYDNPSEADLTAVERVLIREYPEYAERANAAGP